MRPIHDRGIVERPSKRRLVWVSPGPAGRWQTVDSQTGKVIRADYRSRAQAEHHARELMGGKH